MTKIQVQVSTHIYKTEHLKIAYSSYLRIILLSQDYEEVKTCQLGREQYCQESISAWSISEKTSSSLQFQYLTLISTDLTNHHNLHHFTALWSFRKTIQFFTQCWYSIKYLRWQAWRIEKFGRLPFEISGWMFCQKLILVTQGCPRMNDGPKVVVKQVSSWWRSPSPSTWTPGWHL